MYNDIVKDYYKILGLDKDASPDEIKKAYHKLASMYHPDVSTDPNANAKMADINEAYQTLKDPEKRASYDQYGQDSISEDFTGYNPSYQSYDFSKGFIYPASPFRYLSKIIRIIFAVLFITALFRFGKMLFQSFSNEYTEDMNGYSLSFSKISGSNTVYVSSAEPKSIWFIDGYEFVSNITIPETITISNSKYTVVGIGDYVFSKYTNLKTITLPKTIQYIGSYTFKNCDDLETVIFNGTSYQFLLINIGVGNDFFTSANVKYN